MNDKFSAPVLAFYDHNCDPFVVAKLVLDSGMPIDEFRRQISAIIVREPDGQERGKYYLNLVEVEVAYDASVCDMRFRVHVRRPVGTKETFDNCDWQAVCENMERCVKSWRYWNGDADAPAWSAAGAEPFKAWTSATDPAWRIEVVR